MLAFGTFIIALLTYIKQK
ncbi:putative holin-like toxin [Bacillus rugosus]|nr:MULTISPECIES: putative holin-like toxin [Bacillus]